MTIARTLMKTLSMIDSIVFAYLFGSRARREARPSSDVDIAAFLKEDSDYGEEKLKILGAVTEALRSDDVDVVILNTAPLSLLGRILADREILLDREPYRRHAFESLTLRQYLDFSITETAILNRRFGLGR